jgi:hypothetical protein
MLENTKGAIKKGQSRETGNIGYTRRRKTQQKQSRETGMNRYNKLMLIKLPDVIMLYMKD